MNYRNTQLAFGALVFLVASNVIAASDTLSTLPPSNEALPSGNEKPGAMLLDLRKPADPRLDTPPQVRIGSQSEAESGVRAGKDGDGKELTSADSNDEILT